MMTLSKLPMAQRKGNRAWGLYLREKKRLKRLHAAIRASGRVPGQEARAARWKDKGKKKDGSHTGKGNIPSVGTLDGL